VGKTYLHQRNDSKFTKKSTQSWAALLCRGSGSFNTAEDKKTLPFLLRKTAESSLATMAELLTVYAYTGMYCALVGSDLESWC